MKIAKKSKGREDAFFFVCLNFLLLEGFFEINLLLEKIIM